MPLRSVALMMLVCLTWAANVIVGKIMLSDYGLPPLWFAAVRFLIVAALLWRLLTPLPGSFGRVATVGLLMGAAHFGLMFLGLAHTPASTAAIILQLGIPTTTLLSIAFLGERPSPGRILGMTVALAGALVVIWQPGAGGLSLSVLYMVAATVALSVGSVMLKTLSGIAPMRLQAWVAACSAPPLLLLSFWTEAGQVALSLEAGLAFWLSLAFSVLAVTIWAHTTYFRLLQAHDASMIAPLTLALPVMAVAMGVIFTGDVLTSRFVLGAVLVMAGIGIILASGARRRSLPGGA